MAQQEIAMSADAAGPVIARFDNSYARLPARFFQQIAPTKVAAPRLIKLNHTLAAQLGLSLTGLDESALAALFAGNQVPAGAALIAQAYAGHQFGGFSPQLGDGRAILLGEIVDPAGQRHDLQWKGAGPTAFSRRGDGRAALGPVLREYIISEAMHALGIPATRALAAVTTGEWVRREVPRPGAVFTRVADSHVRVGTFQYFVARGDAEALRLLADHVIARHYPAAAGAALPYLELLKLVVAAQARLIAQWMGVGFIHGVMNTDNMAISGQTIDFGPCAFMDEYDPKTVFSSIDEYGRYAYANQPAIAQWNLARFAETLLPILGVEQDQAVELATEAINRFTPAYEAAWLSQMRAKLGLFTQAEEDATLARELLAVMRAEQADFTLTFRALSDAADGAATLPASFDGWLAAWQARLAAEPPQPARRNAMRRKNPAIIPRNHRVEQAIDAAVTNNDLSAFERLLTALSSPYENLPDAEPYQLPPTPSERVTLTYCGT